MMPKSTYEVHFAFILLEDDGFGRHIEDLEISSELSLKLHCYKCSLHKSTLYKIMLHLMQCRDPPNGISFFNGGSTKKKVSDANQTLPGGK
jgi:hypothetical protein